MKDKLKKHFGSICLIVLSCLLFCFMVIYFSYLLIQQINRNTNAVSCCCDNCLCTTDTCACNSTSDNTANTSEETSQQVSTITPAPTPSIDIKSDEDDTSSSTFEADTASSSSPSSSDGSSYQASRSLPPEYYEKQAIADSAIEQYLSGEWDGNPTTMEDYDISISSRGYLLIDDGIASPSEIHPQHCLDLPADISRHDYVYIPGEGAYLIENNYLVHYERGQMAPMSLWLLNWSGMDTKNYRPYDVYFYYDEPHDTLFLVASSVPYDYSSTKLKYNVGIYLYIVPDRTKSQIKFVDEIINLAIDEDGLFYLDTDDSLWRYTEKAGELSFKKSFNTKLKSKFPDMGIANGEIEWDWLCSFADGYIGSRDAFPDGTFTHPVVTTPSVSLSFFEWDYKYKNIYSH